MGSTYADVEQALMQPHVLLRDESIDQFHGTWVPWWDSKIKPYHIEPVVRYRKDPPHRRWKLKGIYDSYYDAQDALVNDLEQEMESVRGKVDKKIGELLQLYDLETPSFYEDFPSAPGLYFLIDNGDIIDYIGQSQNIRQRLNSHNYYDKNAHRVLICEVAIGSYQHAALDNIEIALIGLAMPRLNQQYNPTLRGFK